MNVVEIYSKEHCALCDEAKGILARLKKEFPFELREVKLTDHHPLYPVYKNAVPVVLMPNGVRVSGQLSEDQLRTLLHSLLRPPGIYYAAKFLEALGMVTVLFGFLYGLIGDMWTDLYFFLGGIVMFAIGWGLEKWEARKRKTKAQSSTT